MSASEPKNKAPLSGLGINVQSGFGRKIYKDGTKIVK